MAALCETVEKSDLTERCRIDLMDGVAQLTRHCDALPRRPATVEASGLSPCAFATTVSRSMKQKRPQDAAVIGRYITEKEMSRERTLQAPSTAYFKTHHPKFEGALPATEPYRELRDRHAVMEPERDFVHRYAEATVRSSIGRAPLSGVPAEAAVAAYTEAFRKYTGRDPTEKELEEVERLYFAVAENGAVGIIQKPHFWGSHSHISICNRRCVRCASQVYKAELPPVRGARTRFPGPIPVWSSTKNTYTLVSGDTYVPGLHNVR